MLLTTGTNNVNKPRYLVILSLETSLIDGRRTLSDVLFRRGIFKRSDQELMRSFPVAVNMDPVQCDEAKQEFRVHVTSKKQVNDRLDKYKNILKTALDGQPDVDEDTKRVLVQELLTVRRTVEHVGHRVSEIRE